MRLEDVELASMLFGLAADDCKRRALTNAKTKADIGFVIEEVIEARGLKAADLTALAALFSEAVGQLFYHERRLSVEEAFHEGQQAAFEGESVTVPEYGKIAFQFN